jgi:beta-lactamase regulating signal transducer with metallopeptidase domain
MLKFLDIIMSPEDWEIINQMRNERSWRRTNPQRGLFNTPDFRFNADSTVSNYTQAVDSASVDSVVNKGVADSIPNQDGIIDTLKASITYTNEAGAGDDTTALILTALAIIAALALCFYFIRLYRKRLALSHSL